MNMHPYNKRCGCPECVARHQHDDDERADKNERLDDPVTIHDLFKGYGYEKQAAKYG